jgi:nitrite reductase/ring-hydroxylating ferredoxin subunit
MRRATGLYELSRRDFCGLAGLAIAGCTIGCTDGSTSAVQTGGLNGDEPPDAHALTDAGTDGGTVPHDGSGPPGDASVAATCTGSPTDVGAASTFVAGSPKYFSSGNFFIVRDSGGLYALTAKCTHEGATTVVDSGQFYCPRHGATFSFLGTALSGPVSVALKHYAMCTMANGHVGVETSMVVSQSQRLDA